MIIKSEAVEPKAGSATSVYLAIITAVVESDPFVHLQVYCPDVMSGTIVDAKYALNNWIEAPVRPHNGDIKYDFQIGGLVNISYQNGNINSPQFVRYIQIDDKIRNNNADYILNNVTVPSRSILSTDEIISKNSEILQKSLILLPALKCCGYDNDYTFHTYGLETDPLGLSDTYLDIFRCGKYGTEIIAKKDRSRLFGDRLNKDASFNYLSNLDQSFFEIVQKMMEKETDSNNLINNVINKAIEEFEDNKDLVTRFEYYSDTDRLFWWCNILGYVYDPGNTYDMSSSVNPELNSKIRINKNSSIRPLTSAIKGSKLSQILQTKDTIYRFGLGITSKKLVKLDDINLVLDFINLVWKYLNKDSYFDEFLSDVYVNYLFNNLETFTVNYSVSRTNKVVLILTVIASSFTTLQETLSNLELFKVNLNNSKISNYVTTILSEIKQNNVNSDELATALTEIYKYILCEDTNYYFRYIEDPFKEIRAKILDCIKYINNNYSLLENTMSANETSSTGIMNYPKLTEDVTTKTIWNFFINQGYTQETAAAFLGNIKAENSIFDPQNVENRYKGSDSEYTQNVDDGTYLNFATDGYGYGLCQWTTKTRKQNLYNFAKSKGTSVGDLNTQLEFIISELNSNPGYFKQKDLKKSKDVYESTYKILIYYEGPASVIGVSQEQKNKIAAKRNTYSEAFFNLYKG